MPARLIVSGAVAWDVLGQFAGNFTDNIRPSNLDNLSIAFVVDSAETRRGGTAGNVAYTLGLLGDHPDLVAAVGDDFDEYDRALKRVGVHTSQVKHRAGMPSAVAHIVSDQKGRQISMFWPGAMATAPDIDLGTIHQAAGRRTVLVLTTDDPAAMLSHAEQGQRRGWSIVFAPGQQIPALSDDALSNSIAAASVVVVNEFEADMIKQRLHRTAGALARDGRVVVITRGSRGSEVWSDGAAISIPPAPVDHIVDTTGAGDAYLAGFVHGYSLGCSPEVAGRIGSLAAAYAVEHRGAQDHRFTHRQFEARLASTFGVSLEGTGVHL